MHDPLRPERRNLRPPGNVGNLFSRINAYAHEQGLTPARLQQRVKSELLFTLLDRAREAGIIPIYIAKGGMAIELRFGVRARASGDVDIGIVSEGEELLMVFDRALALGLDDFTFTRGTTLYLANAQAHRIQVRIQYKGRAFGTLDVDLNAANYETPVTFETASVLTVLGLPGPLRVPLLDPYIQIAHKLHGATEPDRPDYVNRRHRDVLDVLIMWSDPSLELSLPRLRATVIAEFARRPHHKVWPPIFAIPVAWRAELAREAREAGFEIQDPEEIARQFIAFIAAIEGVDVKKRYEYEFVSMQLNMTGNEPLEQQARAMIHERIENGWKIVLIGPRPGYVDQYLAVLERPNEDEEKRPLPRIQLRVDTQYGGNNEASLSGTLRNETDLAANRVRVFASNVSEIVRLGTVTRGDGDLAVHLPYERAALRTQRPQFAAVVVEYETDDGVRVQQTGRLIPHGPDASQRYTYTGELGPSRVVQRFTVAHDAGEIL